MYLTFSAVSASVLVLFIKSDVILVFRPFDQNVHLTFAQVLFSIISIVSTTKGNCLQSFPRLSESKILTS